MSMIAFGMGIPLESPMHNRVPGNDKLDVSTLVYMKLSRKDGNQNQPVNGEDMSVPQSNRRDKGHITQNDGEAGSSQPSHSRSRPEELNSPQLNQVTLDMVMAKLNSIVDEMREYYSSVLFKLVEIENKPNIVMHDSDTN
ncbi:hypothetical protein ACLOJK_018889 [Asimina triloba]